MYYLFIYKKQDLLAYKQEFDRVKNSIESGTTPVFNEMRAAKTRLIETFPYQILNAVFIMFGTFALSKIKINDLIKIGVVLVVNNFCGVISNFIFTIIKHRLRIRLCKRLNIEPTEQNISVMESLEYQTV